MTKDQLKAKVAFISDDHIAKHLSVFVTTPSTGLQLFNIEQNDLTDLLDLIVKDIKAKVIDDAEYSLETYSTSLKRDNALYQYDLTENERTIEMTNTVNVIQQQAPQNFDVAVTPIETVNGLYLVIRGDNGESISLYKQMTVVDKSYIQSSFFVFWKHDQMFERLKTNMLKIVPPMHMLQVDNEIILLDMKKLERSLKLDAILERETIRDVRSISNNLIINDNFLKQACSKPSMCKKLRHALAESKVVAKLNRGTITNANIVAFAERNSKLKFHFNDAKTKFKLKSKAEAERFIKLMDDDFLHSELTGEDYDSSDKDVLTA